MATEYVLFTPGGTDPLTIGPFSDGTPVRSLFAPSPSNLFKVNIPNGSGGWTELYQLGEISGELIALGSQGYPEVQIQSDGNGGTAFYVVATDEIFAPWKEGPVISVPPTIDFSSITWYNFLHYGALNNGSTGANGTALASMFTAMSALNGGDGGGYGYFASGSYPVLAGGFTPSLQAYYQGAGAQMGNGPGSCMFVIESIGNFLDITGPHNTSGVTLADLGFSYKAGFDTDPTDVAIIANVQNTKILRCRFNNTPTAVNVTGLSSGLESCTINNNQTNVTYGSNTPATAQPMVRLSAPQCYAIGSGGNEYYQVPIGSNGARNIVAISVEQNCENALVADLHLSDMDYGLTFELSTHSTFWCHFRGLKVDTWTTGLRLVLNSDPSSHAYGHTFTDCLFKTTNGSSSVTSGIVVSASGNTLTQLDDIEWNGCRVLQSMLHGWEFDSGGNFRINGGQASGNGPTGGAGIAVLGQVLSLAVNGTCLNAAYPNANNPSQAQQYAVLFAASLGLTGTYTFENCDMEGYGSSPVSIGSGAIGSGGRLYFKNCPGYTNSGAIVTSTPPASATSASAHNVFCATKFEFSNGTSLTYTLTRDGGPTKTYTVLSANISLGPYDQIFFPSTTPSVFNWVVAEE